MNDRVYLVGVEDVRAAAHAMQEAATRMQQAAARIEDALLTHARQLDHLLDRAEALREPK